MLVSHGKRFIYLKTFKTAGTSIEMYFEPYCVPPQEHVGEKRELSVTEYGIASPRLGDNPRHSWWNHMPASEIRDKLSVEMFDSYFRFCAVRNPYDQLVSAFYFYERAKGLTSIEPEKQIALFRHWASSGTRYLPPHHFLLDGERCVHEVIRYEYLSADIEQVCDALSIDFAPDQLAMTKDGFRERTIQLVDFYDKPTIAIVERDLAPHLELFGYEKPF